MVKPIAFYLPSRILNNEMISRGPWTPERALRIARGFYKFNPPQVVLDERSYEHLQEIDPGLPDWKTFSSLLQRASA